MFQSVPLDYLSFYCCIIVHLVATTVTVDYNVVAGEMRNGHTKHNIANTIVILGYLPLLLQLFVSHSWLALYFFMSLAPWFNFAFSTQYFNNHICLFGWLVGGSEHPTNKRYIYQDT